MVKMTIQRIISANTQPQAESTVAQDYGMAYGGQVAVSNNQIPAPAMERGLTGIPIPDNMFDYAEGGIVAFGDGGDVKRFQTGNPVTLSQALPPFSFSSDVEFRKLLNSLVRSGSYQQLEELLSKMPESDPRHAQIKQAANAARAATAYTPPSMQARPVPNLMGAGFTPPPMQGAPLPPIPGTVTPDPMKEAYEKFVSGSKRIGLSALKNLGAGAVMGIPGAAVEYLTGVNPSDPAAVGRRMLPAGGPSLFALTDEAAKRVISNLLSTKEGKEGKEGEKGRLSAAEFYRNMSPEMQKRFQEALDAAVEAAKRGRPTEASAATPPAATPPAATSTAPRQEERRGSALSSTSSGLSPIIPALPSVGSDQTGDPEKRARTLVDESGLPKVEPLTDEQALQRIKDIEAKSGVDPDFFKKIQGRIDTMREEAKTDKKEAANLRIIEAGLGILGGTSPYAFVNIGKGASEAVKGFGQDLKEYQKARRELDKAEMDLVSAEQNAARTKSNTAINLVERRQEQVNAAKTKEAELYISGVKAFADLGGQTEDRLSREKIAMAGLQARREEIMAQIAQSDRQITESRVARLQAANIAADQRFLDGLTKTENNATKSYDTQIETIQRALSNPAAAITPAFVKEQEAKIDRLIQQRNAAAKLAGERYIANYRSGRPTQNNLSLSAADRIAGIGGR